MTKHSVEIARSFVLFACIGLAGAARDSYGSDLTAVSDADLDGVRAVVPRQIKARPVVEGAQEDWRQDTTGYDSIYETFYSQFIVDAVTH